MPGRIMMAFIVLAAVLMLGRLVWISDYLRRCHKGVPGHGLRAWWTTIATIRTTTTSKLEENEDDNLHQLTIGLSERQLDTSLVGGSVALAAWTQLFVSSASQPGARISGTSSALLFAGALVLIASPMLFRAEGIHLTYIGRETGSHVGFGLVILSLLSIIADLASSWFATAAAILLGVALALRDASETGRHLQIQRDFHY